MVKWTECLCNVWEERRLLRGAEQVVDIEANQFLLVAERQRFVREILEELRENHKRDYHGRWERRDTYRRKCYLYEVC
jgi:hypothetical protein